MDNTVIVAIISMVGTLGGSFLGILASTKLVTFRIEQLEKKVEKHNSVIERTGVLEIEVKNIHDEIHEIKDYVKFVESK